MSYAVFPCQRPAALKDWVSSVSPKIVEKAVGLLKENQPSFCGAANFLGVGETDHWITVGRACHYDMGRGTSDTREVIATSNLTFLRQGGGLSFEEARPFLQWFLYDSPYGFIILNRDDFESCEKYGFVIAGDAPTTLVQSACIISRHFYEAYKTSFVEFNKLVERGIDGFIAYQLCFNSNITNVSSQKLSQLTFNGYGGHRVSECVTPELMLNYYRGNAVGGLGNNYKDNPSIYGSTKLFLGDAYPYNHGLSNYRKQSKAFHEFLLEKEGKLDKSGVYRPPNPFVKTPFGLSEHKFTLEQAVTHVADYIQQYVKENLNV